MTNHCHLCHVGTLTLSTENPSSLKLQQIIESCNKYLEEDILQTLNRNSVLNPFCVDCRLSTSQLLELDIQFQQIDNNIKDLVFQINDKVKNERKKLELVQGSGSQSESDTISGECNRGQETATNSDDPEETMENDDDDDDEEDNGEDNSSDDSDSDPTYNPGLTLPTSTTSVSKRKESPRKQIPARNAKKETISEVKTTVTSSDLQLRHGNDGFMCPNPKCKKRFTRLDILQRHECGNQTYECETCGKSFSSPGSLKLHMLSHSGEKRHKCDTCGKLFILPHHLRLHIRTHTGEKPYECDICQKRFIDSSYLAKHKLQHSTDENERRKYKCNICSKSYTLYSTLKSHMTLHTGETPHKCHICGKLCGRKGSLKNHLMIHTKEKPLKCSICWKAFARPSSLKLHMVTHGGEKKFPCEKCDKSFFSSSALLGHTADMHGENGEYICDTCGRLYKTQKKLDVHKRSHGKPKSTEKFQCVVCKRKYATSRSLTEHQKLVHTVCTQNQVLCSKCDTVFEDYLNYHRHLKRRVSKSVFRIKCEICKEITPTRCELNSHFKAKHGDRDLPHPCQDCGKGFMTKKEAYRHRYHDCLAEKRPITILVFDKNIIQGNKEKTSHFQMERQNVDGNDVKLFGENEMILSSQPRRSARFSDAAPKKLFYGSKESQSEDNYSDYEPGGGGNESPDGEHDYSLFGVDIKEENETYIKQEPADFFE